MLKMTGQGAPDPSYEIAPYTDEDITAEPAAAAEAPPPAPTRAQAPARKKGEPHNAPYAAASRARRLYVQRRRRRHILAATAVALCALAGILTGIAFLPQLLGGN